MYHARKEVEAAVEEGGQCADGGVLEAFGEALVERVAVARAFEILRGESSQSTDLWVRGAEAAERQRKGRPRGSWDGDETTRRTSDETARTVRTLVMASLAMALPSE